ncbi:alanyl-tRNA synthetase [Thermobifida fusca YX]|uniref:Alanine--tRNA ligase n=2 Tax=Thermobifida fusca TaxID=2021 RepID=SYA_THEFY|nr:MULTISPECIES: alanine--tRNA ligase [Thermobifida]Q47N66.1 RecName: Full=Alanine--tRNA ligase; AltName: Full=Alanyl-tRNA synthetase; Short=AlaRS [Thermobifida fusca YX]AAZ56103.1 alanyl-tRNA synthetase [Thermobifida fusca YX]EOR70832.1 alanyl-tRNA synthetase [Thermobifida fusca TM51]MBO2530179.1 alanine--tRNA ligase [Thermobifida sp.]MDD6790925.1 alanine--tRNA ligase [Thermobifida fusca]PPS94372.1 alanyl-tRNA synthetase [Thermobifida fusca]
MKSAEIARRFLAFFEKNGHTVVPSASLIAEDPTLLLVNAGMVPFKPYFLGQRTPPYPRATSVQKCVRTIDIDEVGKTTRHASFFQMLGNFSFGDYFKEKAIPLAWELLTTSVADGGFGFDPERLWVTVYLDDDEAATIWREKVGLPEERIQRRGKADNFWSMGVPGPCGPCSEIYFDRGPEYGAEGGPVADEDRYLEVWNLVFMQFERGEGSGKEDYPILGELPSKNIDTGMGLERMAAILQGVDNIYETDTLGRILRRAAELTGTTYGENERADVSLRVIADHVRTATMLVADGVRPGNEKRGYVLRRILRRSIRNLRLLSGDESFHMHDLTAVAIDAMGDQYPELRADADKIHSIIDAEEKNFADTLRAGTTLFNRAVRRTKETGGTVFSGADAFQLHDTYGFPIDLTLEMAAEHGLKVDEETFHQLMQRQRETAKRDAQAKKLGNADISVYGNLLETGGPTEFLGYTDSESEARVLGIIVNGESTGAARKGDQVELVLDRTPFYAESGGQLADKGTITVDGRGVVDVEDVQKPIQGLFVHRGTVREGEVVVDDTVHAAIDTGRRASVSRSHSATHLIHSALRNTLGPSAGQAGSENQPGRLRFDFTSDKPLDATEIAQVEEEVNEVLARNIEVQYLETTLDEALRMGALAMFGEKYGNRVRVVDMTEYSRELCGGTHVAATGQLGLVKVLGESSVGSGVRRVEALVGLDALRRVSTESALVGQLSEQLKAPREELPQRIDSLVSRLRAAEKEIERLRAAQVLQAAGKLAESARDHGNSRVVTHRVEDGTTADDMRKLALDVRGRLGEDRPAVVAIAGVPSDRPVVVVAINKEAQQAGLKAGELVGVAARALGGGGGGRPDIAQGGGSDVTAIDTALRLVEQRVAGS